MAWGAPGTPALGEQRVGRRLPAWLCCCTHGGGDVLGKPHIHSPRDPDAPQWNVPHVLAAWPGSARGLQHSPNPKQTTTTAVGLRPDVVWCHRPCPHPGCGAAPWGHEIWVETCAVCLQDRHWGGRCARVSVCLWVCVPVPVCPGVTAAPACPHSYRRFCRLDDVSAQYWSRSGPPSATSLDNPAFSTSEELLHLHIWGSSCSCREDSGVTHGPKQHLALSDRPDCRSRYGGFAEPQREGLSLFCSGDGVKWRARGLGHSSLSWCLCFAVNAQRCPPCT